MVRDHTYRQTMGAVGEGANSFNFIFSTVPIFYLYMPMQEEDEKMEDRN